MAALDRSFTFLRGEAARMFDASLFSTGGQNRATQQVHDLKPSGCDQPFFGEQQAEAELLTRWDSVRGHALHQGKTGRGVAEKERLRWGWERKTLVCAPGAREGRCFTPFPQEALSF
jgi:hypothetical protein